MGIFSDIGGGIGGFIGGQKAKKYSKKAAKAQIEAANKGIGEVNAGWDYTKGIFAPWQQAGTGALGGITDLLGLGQPDAQQAAIDQLKASPYYQSLYRTGEEAVLQNASATGGLRGGNTQRSLADFGADTLSQTIDHQLQGLGNVAQMGYGATGQLGGYGAAHSSDIANLYLGQGQASAADYMRRAGIAMGQWQGLGSAVGGVADAAAAWAMPGGMPSFGSIFGGGGAGAANAGATAIGNAGGYGNW